MYIEPNTNIILLKNAPITNNYKDTLWFDNKSDQEKYFKSLTAFDLKNYTYQRVNLGVTRVGINAEKLYNCNYMMFQNTSFGNKWFYAFITKVEYVNNGMSHVHFEIDVMQTWLFDYTLEECFVEREHSKTDNIGDNIVAESLGTDDYVVNKHNYKDFSDMQVYIYATGLPSEEEENGVTTPKLVGGQAGISYGILNGMTIYQRVLNSDNLDEINRVIDSYIDKGLEDALILIQQMPYFCGRPNQTEVPKESFTFSMNSSTLDGYKPKNNKLFTYPYNFLMVSNHSGSVDQFQFEYFDDCLNNVFNFYGVPLSTPIIDCVPKNYRGVSEDFDSGVTLSNFPQCAWSGDAYKAWIAQNKGSILASYDANAINTGGSVLGKIFSGRIGQAINTGIQYGFNIEATERMLEGQIQDAKARPNNVHGKIQCDSLNVALDKVGYSFYQMCVHKEHAETIDNFFTMFGYATKKIKVPNRNVRKCFTYTKTVGCTIIGELPSDDISKICDLYNNGITFWKNPSLVGYYSADNSPT